MRRVCLRCSKEFQGRSSRAVYCSGTCRVAANRAKKSLAGGVVVDLPVPKPGQSLEDAVVARLAGREEDPVAQIAVALARRIDHSRMDTASGVASLARELRSTLAVLGSVSPAAGEEKTGGKVAQFRARRAAAAVS